MKIALVGNMNNNSFSLCRYLRDEGFNCKLFIFDSEPEHFHPKNDTIGQEFTEYCEFLDWSTKNWSETSSNNIKKLFKPFHFIICQGVAPAFFLKANIQPDVFLPYGGDLYNLPFYNVKSKTKKYLAKIKRVALGKGFQLPKERFHKAQLIGIKNCSSIVVYNEEWGAILKKNDLEEKWKKVPLPMAYISCLNENELDLTHLKEISGLDFQLLKKNEILIFFSHTRHYWLEHGKPIIDKVSNKGNDKLIKGYWKYLKDTNRSSILVLLEYGPDVLASKELVKKLGIGDNVHWIPLQPRKNIMIIISKCHLVCNEFNNSWLGGGVIFEALSLGKPLLGFRDDNLYTGRELYPMLNAFSYESIAESFKKFEKNPNEFQKYGEKSRRWYQKHVVNKCLDYFTSEINKKKKEILKIA